MVDAFTHQPVLVAECVSSLRLREDALIVDATVGGGGHAAAILARTGPHGRLLGLDQDANAVAAAGERLARFGDRVQLFQHSFRHLETLLEEQGIEAVDGVLLDLGVSSHQLDTTERGFRFAAESADTTPLDMRMDQRSEVTAADLLRDASEEELRHWFRAYADLRGASRLARRIVSERRRAPLRSSADLLAVIESSRVGGGRRHHPATRVFQALRIALNDELGALEDGLEAAIGSLRAGGRVVVLAYHSAEDRIVKRRFRDEERGCTCPPEFPVCACGRSVRLRLLMRRPVRPEPDEVARNPRARSARLRAAERLAEAA